MSQSTQRDRSCIKCFWCRYNSGSTLLLLIPATANNTIQRHPRMRKSVYVRILGSSQEVVRLIWLMKYISPELVTACSQPSGSVPSGSDTIGVDADSFATAAMKEKGRRKGMPLILCSSFSFAFVLFLLRYCPAHQCGCYPPTIIHLHNNITSHPTINPPTHSPIY